MPGITTLLPGLWGGEGGVLGEEPWEAGATERIRSRRTLGKGSLPTDMEMISLHFNNQYGQTIMYQLIYPQVKPLKNIETTDCVKPIWGPCSVAE